MVSFRIDGKPYTLPATWAEVPAAHLQGLVVCRLLERTPAMKLRWFRQLTGVPVQVLRRIEAEVLHQLTALLDWVWEQELGGGLLAEYEHQGVSYQLVAPDLSNMTWSEYALARHHLRQFTLQHSEAELHQLLGTIFRPARPEQECLSANWDGDLREAYNAHQVQRRLPALAALPLGVKQLILAQFIAGQSRIQQVYPQLFPKPTASSGNEAEPVEGSADIDLAYSLADTGVFGTFEQTCQQNLYTILEYLDSNRRKSE